MHLTPLSGPARDETCVGDASSLERDPGAICSSHIAPAVAVHSRPSGRRSRRNWCKGASSA